MDREVWKLRKAPISWRTLGDFLTVSYARHNYIHVLSTRIAWISRDSTGESPSHFLLRLKFGYEFSHYRVTCGDGQFYNRRDSKKTEGTNLAVRYSLWATGVLRSLFCS